MNSVDVALSGLITGGGLMAGAIGLIQIITTFLFALIVLSVFGPKNSEDTLKIRRIKNDES